MKRILLAVLSILAPLAVTATPANAQAVRHYDCTKAGNANKAVCKGAATVPAATQVTPVTTSARHYDCSKAGNANKAVCKSAAPSPTVVKAAPAAPAGTATRHYDCSKTGNATKAVCKGATATVAPAPASRSAPAAVPASRAAPVDPASRAPVTGQNTNPAGPNGATAKCRDGSLSFSAHRSGTCSRHGGVAQFF